MCGHRCGRMWCLSRGKRASSRDDRPRLCKGIVSQVFRMPSNNQESEHTSYWICIAKPPVVWYKKTDTRTDWRWSNSNPTRRVYVCVCVSFLTFLPWLPFLFPLVLSDWILFFPFFLSLCTVCLFPLYSFFSLSFVQLFFCRRRRNYSRYSLAADQTPNSTLNPFRKYTALYQKIISTTRDKRQEGRGKRRKRQETRDDILKKAIVCWKAASSSFTPSSTHFSWLPALYLSKKNTKNKSKIMASALAIGFGIAGAAFFVCFFWPWIAVHFLFDAIDVRIAGC